MWTVAGGKVEGRVTGRALLHFRSRNSSTDHTQLLDEARWTSGTKLTLQQLEDQQSGEATKKWLRAPEPYPNGRWSMYVMPERVRKGTIGRVSRKREVRERKKRFLACHPKTIQERGGRAHRACSSQGLQLIGLAAEWACPNAQNNQPCPIELLVRGTEDKPQSDQASLLQNL